jgi:hypothetical protein
MKKDTITFDGLEVFGWIELVNKEGENEQTRLGGEIGTMSFTTA